MLLGFSLKEIENKKYLFYNNEKVGEIVYQEEEKQYILLECNIEDLENKLYQVGEYLKISNLDYSFDYLMEYLKEENNNGL